MSSPIGPQSANQSTNQLIGQPPTASLRRRLPLVIGGAVLAIAVAATLFFVLRPDPGSNTTAGGDVPNSDLKAASADLLVLDVYDVNLGQTDIHEPGDAGRIVSPEGTLTVLSVASVPTVAPQAGGESFRPADGYRFIAFTTTWTPNDDDQWEFDTTAAIDADGAKRDLTEKVVRQEYSPNKEVITIASVPEDDPGKLVLSYDGHDQIFDLAALERAADPTTEVLYRADAEQPVDEQASSSAELASKAENQEVTYTLTIDSARISAHGGDDLGWATPGSAWVIIHFEEELDGDCCAYRSNDPTYEQWLISADGTAPVSAASAYRLNSSSGEGYAVFPVSASTEHVSLSLTTTYVFKGSVDPDLTHAFGPLEFDVTFPL